MKEINITELKNALEDSFQLVDIRDEGSVIYGIDRKSTRLNSSH